MARFFDFSDATKREARLRQFGNCAVCGESMSWVEEHAHHVFPNQAGDPSNAAHAWIRSAENCVILCYLCHGVVHEYGRYRDGSMAQPEYFEHSHGSDRVAHLAWVQGLNHRMRLVWGPAASQGKK
jgi:5-methylcytosine-specific restriction endonuclease McrA